MIYWRLCFLFNSAKRKFKWGNIGKIGSKLVSGLFGRDLDDDAYAIYQGEENEEGE